MIKTTQKIIKGVNAIDITRYSEEQIKQLPRLEKIAYSVGMYGMNGLLLEDENGKRYKITSRSTNLFRF